MAKNVKLNPAEGFFNTVSTEPHIEISNAEKTGEKSAEQESKSAEIPIAPTTYEKKEKRVAITFNIDESLEERLSRFVFQKRMAKEKISKTQILTDALIRYLDEVGF